VVGTVAAGCIADLIAVRRDPPDDLGALKEPPLVLQAGGVAVDRR